MKQILVMILMVAFVQPVFANDRIYASNQGSINLDMLEKALSERLQQEISDTNLRWTYSPFDYVNGVSGPFHKYTLEFVIAQKYEVACTFTIIDGTGVFGSDVIMITDCSSSPDALVDIRGFVDFAEVGLVPKVTAIPKFISK